MIGLETARLKYRQWQENDFDAIREFYASPSNARFVGGVKNPEEAWRLMATYIGHYHLKGFSYLPLEEKVSGKLVGTVGLWNSSPWPELELGYWILPEMQGKGYAYEAGLAMKSFAFFQLNATTLVSYIDPQNLPSQKLAQKLGAVLDKKIQLLDFGWHEVYRYSSEK